MLQKFTVNDPKAVSLYIHKIELLRHGELSLSELNVWLQGNEWQPLSPQSLETYSPVRDANWHIALAVAYLLTGHDGAALEALFRYKTVGRSIWMEENWAAAYECLLDALRERRVTATGVPLEGGLRKAITPLEWHDLDWIQVASAEVIVPRGTMVPRYRDVLFNAEEVRQSVRRSARSAEAGTAGAESAYRRALVDIMRVAPNDPRPKAKVRAELAPKIGHKIGTRAFVRAWRDASTEAHVPAWMKPGRRPNKNRNAAPD